MTAGGEGGGKEDRTSVGLKTSHESEMAAAAGGGGFGRKCFGRRTATATADFGRRTAMATTTRGWMSC